MIRCRTGGSEVGDFTVIRSPLFHWRCGDVGGFGAGLSGSGTGIGAALTVTDGADLKGGDGNGGVAIAGVAALALCVCAAAGRICWATGWASPNCTLAPGTRVDGSGATGER